MAPARWRKPRTRSARRDGPPAPAPAPEGPPPADDRTEACRGRRRSRWWSWPRPPPPSADWRRSLFSERARESPAGWTCAPAAAGGFRPDIACPQTGPARNALSGAYADTRSPKASRTISRKQSNQFRRNLIERQHGGANTRIGGRARHSPHHAGRFVLGNHAAA